MGRDRTRAAGVSRVTRASVRIAFLIPILVLASHGVSVSQDDPAGGRAVQISALVLPFRSIGVSDTTILASRDLLSGELESRGLALIGPRSSPGPLPMGSGACDDPGCAGALASEYGAGLIVYGSMSRLGEKIVVRAHALRAAENVPFYNDQISALTEEDLDTVMRRIAEGISAGRPNSISPTVESVTQAETRSPSQRAGRSGFGFRAGVLYPLGDSYAGGDRLTNLRLSYKYETRDFLVETTTLTGLSWRGDTAEWSILDLFMARVLGLGDRAVYAGGGLGVHALHAEAMETPYHPSPQDPEYLLTGHGSNDQSSTTFTMDAGVGLILLRTYDFQLVADLRYHHVFEDFDKVGGGGARGFLVTLGTSR